MTLRLLLLLISLLILNPAFARLSVTVNLTKTPTADEEYDRYKREGDELFRKGEYDKARKKFLACLLIPKFDTDSYAKGKIQQCVRAMQLQQEGETALNTGKGLEAVQRFKQVLLLNPDDPITRKTLADYWGKEANQKYTAKNYEAAKTCYEEALKYSPNGQYIQQIRSCDEKLAELNKPREEPKPVLKKPDSEPVNFNTPADLEPVSLPVADRLQPAPTSEPIREPQPSKTEPIKFPQGQFQNQVAALPPRQGRVGTTILVGLIGVGAGGYAYVLNSQWQTKLKALNTVSSQVDPDGDGIVLGQANYNRWKTANDEAKAAQSKHPLLWACLGAATGAALLETHLLFRKPKPAKGLSFSPASHSMGVAVRFDF